MGAEPAAGSSQPATSSPPVAVYTDSSPEEDLAPGVSLLEQAGLRVRVLDAGDPERIRGQHDAAYLLLGSSRVTAATMEALPHLRGIATRSVGTDTVDVDAAAARGVPVGHLSDVSTEEVATHTVALALAAVRQVVPFDRAVRAGRWVPSAEHLRRPSTLTWGIVGMGRIGRAVADRARHLVGCVVGFDPGVAAASWPAGVERATALSDLLPRADVLSLHVPLLASTRHLIGPDELASLPVGAQLINVARGGVVDGSALRDALDRGHLAGAALDVLDVEPPAPDDPLVGHPRVVVTPHVAYLSRQSTRAAVLAQAELVRAWAQSSRRPVAP